MTGPINNHFNTFALKEYSKRDLLRVLDSVRGRKALVIDPSVSGPLSLVAEFNLLKDHGVEKIYHLSDQIIETECKNIIYLTRPNIQHVRWIANQIKSSQSSQTSSSMEYSIFFVPRRSLICDKFLEDEGIFGDCSVGEFHLDLIPFDEDLLSLEMNDCFRSLFVDGDTTVLKILSNALMKFQILYGFFPKVLGKGDHASSLASLLERSRLEYLSNVTGQVTDQKDSEFDSMVILDRSVDYITPFRSQLTYEGLLDELYSINSCFVELDASFFPPSSISGNAKSKKIMVNGSDVVFSAIRDQSFEMVPEVLNGIALQIQMDEGSHHTMSTTGELKSFAAKLGSLTAQKQALSTHQKVYEKILKMAQLPPVSRRWKLEEAITFRGIDSSSLMDQVDDLLAMGVAFTIPLKLVCLYSVANGGLKQKYFDLFRRDFCHAYGAKYMFTLQNLEKLGILIPSPSSSSKAKFAQLSKSLHLANDYESSVDQSDASYAYAGYAPISLRLIQAAAKSLPGAIEKRPEPAKPVELSWDGVQDVLNLVPGETFEHSIIPDSKMYKSSRNSSAAPMTLVVFVGGCTLAEVSALRTISQNERYASVLQQLSGLRSLDLSSNNISSLDGIQYAANLQSLNLSNNRIDTIPDLSSMIALEFLNLSFNHIQKLEGFVSVHGPRFKLKFLDLKGNQVSEEKQIGFLAGCANLHHLVLKTHHSAVTTDNPICKKANYSSIVFGLLSQIRSLDGFDVKERPVETQFDLVSVTDYLEETSTVINSSLIQSQGPSQMRDPSNQQVLEKMSELERKMENLQKIPAVKKDIDEDSGNQKRMTSLETQIVKLVEVISETSRPKQHIPPPVEPSVTTVTAKPENEDRLKHIEAQMKELIQMTANKETAMVKQSSPTRQLQKSMKKQLNALKALENEILNPTISLSSSDEAINIPTIMQSSNIPFSSKENIPPEQRARKMESVALLRPESPTKKTIRAPGMDKGGIKPPATKRATTAVDAANAKLISALEAEERRLRDNEFRYAERIKSLSAQLEIERGGFIRAQDLARQLEQITRKLSSVSADFKSSEAAKQELSSKIQEMAKERMMMEQKVSSMLTKTKTLDDQLATLQNTLPELAKTKKDLGETLSTLKQLEKLLSEAQETVSIFEADKNKLAMRLVKEREQGKIKIAEILKEKQLALEATSETCRQMEYLKQTLAQKEDGFRDKIEKLINSHQYEIDSKVAAATNILENNHSRQMKSLQESVNSSHQAFKALEDEFRLAMSREKKAKEQLNYNLAQRTDEIRVMANRDKDQTDTITDLVQLVKELKSKLEKSVQAETQVTRLHREYIVGSEREIKSLLVEKESLRHKLCDFENHCVKLEAEKKELVAEKNSNHTNQVKLAELQASTSIKIQDLERTVFQLSKEFKSVKEKLVDKQDALKIKESMLEDQNSTIKTLKLNLENKAREFQTVLKELDDCRHELEGRKDTEQQVIAQLKHDLESVEENEQHYRSIAQEYKVEREHFRSLSDSLQSKLSERNASIEKIEQEVQKVEMQFQQKIAAIEISHKHELESLMTKTQTDRQKAEYYGKEKESLIAKVKQFQKQLDVSLQQKRELESELKYVVNHMDSEKTKAEERIRKLKAALDS